MIPWILGLLALAGGVYAVLWWGAGRSAVHRRLSRDDLARFIDVALTRGGEDAVVFIEHEGSDRFVQFINHVNGDGSSTLSLVFPGAPWSSYPAVRERLTAAGFDVNEQRTAGAEIIGFLVIDGIDDPSVAARIAVLAFDAMALDADATFTVRFQGEYDGGYVR